MTGNLAAFEQLVRSRHSVRTFAERPVKRELVDRLLQAACQAPSAHNRQPWRFAVLTSSEARVRLAQAMGARLEADRLADGDDPPTVNTDVTRSRGRIAGAPVAVLVCLTMEEMDKYPDEKRSKAEYLMAVQGAAMAGENLLLAAQAAGLGGSWMCAPLFAPAVAREALGLAASWEPQGLVLLGWPAAPGKERGRRPQTDVAVYL
jgi:F420 biosynthesis protein FbiB-like protein